MKLSKFKAEIKKSVKEAIQEELKDILLESIKNNSQQNPITESVTPTQAPDPEVKKNFREEYRDFLQGDKQFTSEQIQPKQPLQITSTNTAADGASLPEGEMSLDQISNFLPKKN